MVRRKELENSQRTISDIEKHLETSKLKLKELVAEGNQKMDEKANLKKELGVVHQILSPISNSESTNFFNEYLLWHLFQLANWEKPLVLNQ